MHRPLGGTAGYKASFILLLTTAIVALSPLACGDESDRDLPAGPRSLGSVEKISNLTASGWCAALNGDEAVPQTPVVFEAQTGWLAFGGHFLQETRTDLLEALGARKVQATSLNLGWRYIASKPGRYLFFCNDRKIGETNLTAP